MTLKTLPALENLAAPKSALAKGAHILALSKRILGTEALSLVAFSIPVGFISGLLEIVFAVELQRLLIRFGLLPGSGSVPLPLHIPIIVNPLADVLVVSALLVLFRFFTLALPPIAGELFLGRVRRQIVNYITFTDYASVDLSSMEASHLLSNMAPRSQSFFASLSQFLTTMVMVAVLFLGMISISWRLAVPTIAVAGLILFPVMRLRRVFNSYSVRCYALIHAITRRMMSDIRNLHLVKLMGADMYEHDHLFKINDEFIGVQRLYYFMTNFVAVVPMLLGIWIVVGVIWTNSTWSLIAPSVLVPFIYLLYRLASTISQGLSYGGAMIYAFPFFRSLSGVWEEKLEKQHRSIPLQLNEVASLNEVAVQDLSIGRDEVFFVGLNFSLGAGATLLIRGESGRGKTTLLLTLVGMLPAKSGTIRWNGNDIVDLDTGQLRRAIGYAGADPFLLDVTIRENLLFGASDRRASEGELDHALWCAAADFVKALPQQKETLLREDGDGISAGQKQRIALARALLLKPKVLFLDEAMANIDEATEELIMCRLRETYPGMIIIAVSHRSSMRRWATTTLDI